MRITCEKCNAVYSIAEKILGPSGRMVKCAKCFNNWMVIPLDANNITSHKTLAKKDNKTENTISINYPKIIFALVLTTSILILSFLLFSKELIKYKPLKSVYNKFSIYESNNIKLNNFTYKTDYTDIIIDGTLINDSDEDKKLPSIRYTLLDKNKKVIFTSTMSRKEYTLKKREELPITYRINNIRKPVKYLQIDIGNKLDLMLGPQ